MKLHAIKAFHGDCLLLESGDTPPRFVLIDGGPPGTFDTYGRDYLEKVLGPALRLDTAVVSHVDADHIIGMLDLLAEIEARSADDQPSFEIGDLWHNAFTDTIDTKAQDISQGIQTILDIAGAAGQAMSLGQVTFLGIADGAKLERSAVRSHIPINKAFGGALISPDRLADPNVGIGDISLKVVGPTDANLRALQAEWIAWLQTQVTNVVTGVPDALANVDKSIPNLSSIVLLAESAGHRVLLTGDARGDHILQGLGAAGLLAADGSIELDVLKVQHHGSDRNTDRAFFEAVRARTYVISANGKYGNPDLETLTWIVETAVARAVPITLVVTNQTPTLDALAASHPPDRFGYTLVVPDESAAVIEIA